MSKLMTGRFGLEPVSRRERGFALALLGSMCIAGVVLFNFHPSEAWWYPKCHVYSTTGMYCPGCGSSRSVHHLVNGRYVEAIEHNQLLVLLGRGVVLLVAHSGFCNARFGVLCGMFGCCAWWFGLVSEGAKKSFLVCVANAVCDTTILRCQQQGRKTATPTLLLLLASFLALCSSSPGWLAGWLAW